MVRCGPRSRVTYTASSGGRSERHWDYLDLISLMTDFISAQSGWRLASHASSSSKTPIVTVAWDVNMNTGVGADRAR